ACRCSSASCSNTRSDSTSLSLCASHGPYLDPRGATGAEHFRDFIYGAARRDYVIDDGDVSCSQRRSQCKRVLGILETFFSIQRGLLVRFAVTNYHVATQCQLQRLANGPRQLARLIETALP